MTLAGVKNYEKLIDLLRCEKKVKCSRTLQYVEDMNPYDSDSKRPNWGNDLVKRTNVVYLWTNSQFNRMFAKLIDGREVDYPLSFMDMYWGSFSEYFAPEPPKNGWRDVFDAGKSLPWSFGDAARIAKDAGYLYFAFNGRVYPVSEQDTDSPICFVEDL